MLSRASSLVYGRLSLAAADLAKRGDQIIEGVRVLHEHLAAILGQPAPAIEAGDRRFDSSRKPPLVFKREPNVDEEQGYLWASGGLSYGYRLTVFVTPRRLVQAKIG
jgi:hypothetical protein